MGLDLALGGLVLLMGIRGWLKGFVFQTIRLSGLVSCVYLADPIRDLAKPRVIGYLPTLHPKLVDQIVWVSSAVVAYVVLVGIASLIVKFSRRKHLGDPLPYRNDQFAGFFLGSVKGLALAALVAAGVAAGLQKYAVDRLKTVPWAEQQARTSVALRWTDRYQPVPKVWAMPPVQHFVNRIQRMGLRNPAAPSAEAPPAASVPPAEAPPVATANQLPKMALPPGDRSVFDTTDLNPELAKAVEEVFRKIERPDN
jgi:uncharacterized membrane protein required for colicin V production